MAITYTRKRWIKSYIMSIFLISYLSSTLHPKETYNFTSLNKKVAL